MSTVIVGIDEAGRGALAGPVVAGACVLDDALLQHPLVQDSKKLSPTQREEVYEWLTGICQFGVGIVEATTIDAIGILPSTEKAMQDAVARIAKETVPTYLLVDGKDKFWFDYPHSSVIKGDEKEPCISAASIIAKVSRDRMMVEASEDFVHYGFEQHKGYGTPEHFAAIEEHGLTILHRRTFVHSTSSKDTSPGTKSEVCITDRVIS